MKDLTGHEDFMFVCNLICEHLNICRSYELNPVENSYIDHCGFLRDQIVPLTQLDPSAISDQYYGMHFIRHLCVNDSKYFETMCQYFHVPQYVKLDAILRNRIIGCEFGCAASKYKHFVDNIDLSFDENGYKVTMRTNTSYYQCEIYVNIRFIAQISGEEHKLKNCQFDISTTWGTNLTSDDKRLACFVLVLWHNFQENDECWRYGTILYH